jgi:hypothetical protein
MIVAVWRLWDMIVRVANCKMAAETSFEEYQ